MRPQGERFLTPKKWREIRRGIAMCLGLCALYVPPNESREVQLKRAKHEDKVLSLRVKQAWSLLSGLHSKVLIRELGGHAATWSAIEKSNLD